MTLRLATLLDRIAPRRVPAASAVTASVVRAAATDPFDRLARIVTAERAREQGKLRVRVLHQAG